MFANSERRGTDAAGFWGADATKIFYHKEPNAASNFVQTKIWQDIIQYQPEIFLTHARGASKGVGGPEQNYNNHPFVNNSKTIGLIHNGRIADFEYQTLLEKYEVESNCDSEILLRIFENRLEYATLEMPVNRLSGIRDIFSYIHCGHMAVAIGEKTDKGMSLFLFRNQHRPLWLIDLREQLGQIFFVSEPSIWLDSRPRNFRAVGLLELPSNEIWLFQFQQEISLYRYYVEQCGEPSPWHFEGSKIHYST